MAGYGLAVVVAFAIALWVVFVVGGLVMARIARRIEEPTPTVSTVPPVPPVAPVPRVPPVPEARPTVRGTGQVLFAQHDGPALRVDCVLVGSNTEGVAPGSLLTFRLFPPQLPTAGAPFDTILTRWAGDSRLVDLELRPFSDGWRLRLDDGALRLNLEICPPARVR